MEMVLVGLRDDLKDHSKRLDSIIARMNQDIKDKDFGHLARLSVEAGDIQARIEVIQDTIKSMEYYKSE